MKYHITIGEYRVNTLRSVSVKRSVEQLSDTAVITLLGTLINQPLEVNDKINVGDPVRIELGYDGYMNEEFTGYVKRINTDDTEIRIECEDELYLWEVAVKDKQYDGSLRPVTLKTILQDLAKQVNGKYAIECDFDFSYSKFTIQAATALDVLRKIQDETKANIYFEGTTLHIHPLYGNGSWSGNTVKYDLAQNVVSANLQYKKAGDQKLKVEIIDKSKQYKNGTYYVIATDVSFSESGGRRKVTIGRKV